MNFSFGGSIIAGNERRDLEARSGKKVVSSKNTKNPLLGMKNSVVNIL